LPHPTRPAAKSVAELLGPSLDPVLRKRGLARAELLSWWPDIVGAAYAPYTAPDHIRWPRDGRAATLFVRCDAAVALQFAHEADRVRERLNGYFGYAAVGALRIIQQPLKKEAPAPERTAPPLPELPAAIEERMGGLEPSLGESLRTLGRHILARS
jgi:hypothetical protein